MGLLNSLPKIGEVLDKGNQPGRAIYLGAVFVLPSLGFILLCFVLFHVWRTFSSEAVIWTLFFGLAVGLLGWVMASMTAFRRELSKLEQIANGLRAAIAPGAKAPPHPAAFDHFDDLVYGESDSGDFDFYPRIFDLDSRYALERLPAVLQVGVQHIPALLTALGIFFTFVGLIVGIGEINLQGSAEGLMEGMTTLLGGVGLAFYSSLAGIALSFMVLIATRVQITRADSVTGEISNLAEKIESERDRNPATVLRDVREQTRETGNTLHQVLNESQDQTTKLGKLGSDIAEHLSGTLSDAIDESIGEPLVEMNEQLVEFQQEGLDVHQETLGNVLDAFLEEFRESMGEQFSQLDSSLEQTLEWHEETRETLDSLLERMSRERDHRVELLEKRREFEEELFERQVEFHDRRHEELRELFEDTRKFYDEQLEQQRDLQAEAEDLRSSHLEQQRELLEQRRSFHEKEAELREETLDRLAMSVQTLEESADSLENSHMDVADLVESSLQQSEKLHRELAEATENHSEQLESLQNTLARLENTTNELPREYKALMTELHEELEAGLGKTFEMFDQSTSEIVERLSGSYVRIENLIEALDEKLDRIPAATEPQSRDTSQRNETKPARGDSTKQMSAISADEQT